MVSYHNEGQKSSAIVVSNSQTNPQPTNKHNELKNEEQNFVN